MRGALILASVLAILGAVAYGTKVGSEWAAGVAAEKEAEATPMDAASVDERLGWQLPLDPYFTNLEDTSARLGSHLGIFDNDRPGAPKASGELPTVLVPAYFNCRTLCNLILDGMVRSLAGLDREIGRDYQVVTISIDPRDTPADAREKIEELGVEGWEFLVGGEGAIEEVMTALGYGYAYDRSTDQYSHPAVVAVLTPSGVVSSYLYGIDPGSAEVEAALVEAELGGTRSTFERILMRCYHFIPALERYSGLVTWTLRGFGVGTLVGFGLLLRFLIKRVPRRRTA